jgi:adenine-specific DNA-methyltransferase
VPNYLDSLLSRIDDPDLRESLSREVSRLKDTREFGLVFERHLPERTRLHSHPVRKGVTVEIKSEGSGDLWIVESVQKGNARISRLSSDDSQTQTLPTSELVVVREFGDPIYPGLKSIATVERGGDKPYHAVINSENYHALELLRYAYEGLVSCVFVDPPYNTGSRDWKYNNAFIDQNDAYRHSKWLSFMEKRLKIARQLLKPDGVLIVTIDTNELHHLGVLLESLFPEAVRQLVTICINPGGSTGDGLSRVEEYAIFCFLGGSQPAQTDDDMLIADASSETVHTSAEGVRWEWLMRGGNSWYRESRPNLCFPIILNEDGTRIVRAGEPLQGPDEDRPREIDGLPVAYPVRGDGKLGIWRVDAQRLNWLAEEGYVYVSRRDDSRDSWTLKYLMTGVIDKIAAGTILVTGRDETNGRVLLQAQQQGRKTAKTMWFRGRHTAGGAGGTQLVADLIGERGAFSFPKSVYAVTDALEIATGNDPEAIILDFFGGSGTTMHATAMLNLKDGGRRQCILVTNNEVNGELATTLTRQGLVQGDPEWEARGIFEAATMPRCIAALTGKRADGTDVPGRYIDGGPIADGLPENAEFFAIEYLDRNRVSLGQSFAHIAPLLWLKAGGQGPRIDKVDTTTGWTLPDGSTYGVLFDVQEWRPFVDAFTRHATARHAFIVTGSIAAFQQVTTELPPDTATTMLYEDYLSAFEINTTGNEN